MLKTLQKSFIFRLIVTLSEWVDQMVLQLYQVRYKKTPKDLMWVKKGAFYRLSTGCLKHVHKVQDGLSKAGANSLVFGFKERDNFFSKLFRLFDTWFVVIPFSYLFIDFAIRRIPALSILGSVWDELLLVFALMVVFLRPLWLREGYAFKFGTLDFLVALYIAIGVGLLGFVSPDFSVGLAGFRAVFQYVIWFFVFRQLITPKNRYALLGIMVATGLFLGVHGLYQIATGAQMLGNWVDATETITTRAFSIVGSPNILAALFVLLVPVGMTMVVGAKNWFFKAISFISTVMMLGGMLFTYSRQAYLAFAGAIGIVFLMYFPKIIKYMIVVIGALLAAMPSVSERLFYLFTPDYFVKSAKGGRVVRYLYAIEQWLKEPFMGQGLGRFGGAVATQNDLTPFYVDSYYLKTLGEMGAIGLSAMLTLFVSLLVKVKRLVDRQTNARDMVVLLGIFIGLMGIIFQNAVENVFEVPTTLVYFWGLVAIALSFDEMSL